MRSEPCIRSVLTLQRLDAHFTLDSHTFRLFRASYRLVAPLRRLVRALRRLAGTLPLLFRPLRRLVGASYLLLRALRLLFGALRSVFRALRFVVRPLHRLVGTLRFAVRPLRFVFRSLRLLFGALRLLFGAPRRLFGTLPCQREVCLHLSQLSGDRRQLRRLGIEIATIDVEAWREIRRFAIRCHGNEIGRARQTDAGLEMRVAAPVEYQRRRRRAGVGEQRRADQRTLLHEPDVAERALQQRGEFAVGSARAHETNSPACRPGNKCRDRVCLR